MTTPGANGETIIRQGAYTFCRSPEFEVVVLPTETSASLVLLVVREITVPSLLLSSESMSNQLRTSQAPQLHYPSHCCTKGSEQLHVSHEAALVSLATFARSTLPSL